MNSAYLDSIKEKAAEIAVKYTNGRIQAALEGNGDYDKTLDHSMRVHYLLGAINNVTISGGITYMGNTAIDDSIVKFLSSKIWHYNGIYNDVDLALYPDITPDDGDGGTTDPTVTPTVDDHYRVGSLAVGVGANVVTFYLRGVATPFPNTNYEVDAWLLTNTGYMQRQVVVSNKLANGFTVEDILEAGVLHYQAILNS